MSASWIDRLNKTRPPRLSSVKAEQDLERYGGLPIDRMAAIVVSRGVTFEPESLRLNESVWEVPPPVVEHWGNRKRPDNLMGLRFGRLTVYGYSFAHKNKVVRDERGRRIRGGVTQKHSWVCRCSCGLYVRRSDTAIKGFTNGKNPCAGEQMCPVCLYLERLKKREHLRIFGRWPDEQNTS
jgi:hypothetical protein